MNLIKANDIEQDTWKVKEGWVIIATEPNMGSILFGGSKTITVVIPIH